MKIEGNKITLNAGESIIIEAKEKEDPKPTPEYYRMTLSELLEKFNPVLISHGYNDVKDNMSVRNYLEWACGLAQRYYDNNEWVFREENYNLIYNYRGNDMYDYEIAYNGMQAWLIASILSELVPDSGQYTNTQTELFKVAYEIGGGMSYPLYNFKAFKADPYSMREAASVMYAICRGDKNISKSIENYRAELGGKPIPASIWEDLGYKNTMLSDYQGRRGYRMDYLGYCINTTLFLPASPGPRIEGTTVCEQPKPWNQGQDINLFNESTGNYKMDETINNYFVKDYNMMSETPLSIWNKYSLDKKNKMINVGAIPPCTFIYMFGKKNIKFDGLIYKAYGNNPAYNYYCFSQTNEDTGLVLDGPFSDLQGIYRYNTNGDRERSLDTIATIFDNFRFPTEDPNYGRCRPGCAATRQGGEKNPIHGAAENEIYNVDLTTMVSDDAAGKAKGEVQDGFASDSPRSYVSGHSAQIWGLALIFIKIDNSNKNCENWIRKAYDYSVCRSIGRFHWNSDCVYGRLFGAMAFPIINAMSKINLDPIKNYILNPTPVPERDWSVKLIIKNLSGEDIQSTGEIRLYVDDHIGVDTYLPKASPSAGALYTFNKGENDFSDKEVHCVMHGETYMDDTYNGKIINEVKFYDYRHYNNIDAGFKVSLDISDIRCNIKLNKAGATYVIKIEKL